MSAPAPGVATLRELVARATSAPSPHNAQPWHWTIHPDRVELALDSSVAERLDVNDPDRRELVISCGAALLTFRVAAAQALFETRPEILPDPGRPDLLAVVAVVPGAVDSAFATLHDVVARRRTVWGAFDPTPLPPGLADRLGVEALVEGARLVAVGPGERDSLAELVERADRARYADPRRRAELAGWITSRWAEGPPVEGEYAGQVPEAVPHQDLGERIAAHDGRLLRDAPHLAVLSTPGDDRRSWVMAGQALQRVLLVAAEHRIFGGFLNASCQIPPERTRLRDLVSGRGYPQVVLRLGRPVNLPPATSRRPVGDVVTVHSGPDGLRRGQLVVSPREAGADFTEDVLG
ncbi:MAG: hypothetical protein QG622_1124 [Actinomycetota bacterium]|nr:hypothetical protein [Actinomycetota bacterium]